MNEAKRPDDEARFEVLAARMEAGDYSPLEGVIDAPPTTGISSDELQREIDALEPIESDEPTPEGAPESDRASEEDLRELIALGRPTLSGNAGTGASPKRQFRLPIDLDRALKERAEREHRRPSDIMRDALAAYLDAS